MGITLSSVAAITCMYHCFGNVWGAAAAPQLIGSRGIFCNCAMQLWRQALNQPQHHTHLPLFPLPRNDLLASWVKADININYSRIWKDKYNPK